MRRFALVALTLMLAAPAAAALQAVGPVSIGNGFPLWYEDTSGLKLALCLDQDQVLDQDLVLPDASVLPAGTTVLPCLTEEPFPGNPISFPFNFGVEAFYWAAEAATSFAGTPDPATGLPRSGTALLVLALEAAFANEFVQDGQQVVFARIRIRITAPVPGTYIVTHPFGRVTYDVTEIVPGVERTIDESQDIGALDVGNFLAALADGPGAPELPGDPVPRVDDLLPHRSIGPFLTWQGNPRVNLGGDVYLAVPFFLDPATGLTAPVEQPIEGSPIVPDPVGAPGVPTNFFQIEFVPNANTPADFLFLDHANASNTIRLDRFVVMGKAFNEAPNLEPVAADDAAGTAVDQPVTVDVLANDTDPLARDPADPLNPLNPANTNVHTIAPDAVALVTPGTGALARSIATAQGGLAEILVNVGAGRAQVRYTPPPGFLGDDTFQYVVQDTGGLLSAPATVTVTVEDLRVDRAVFRPKLLRWDVQGSTSIPPPHTITVKNGTGIAAPVLGTAEVRPDGTWRLTAPVPALPDTSGSVAVESAIGARVTAPVDSR